MSGRTKIYLGWWALLGLFLLSLACGKGLPSGPTPLPSASPSPSAPQFPGRLHVDGTEFRGQNNEKVTLLGGIVCCEGYPENGWPFILRKDVRASSADPYVYLQRYADNGANFTHIRLGPFTETGESPAFVAYASVEGGKVNLDEWNDAFWQRLSGTLARARELGVYVEVDLIDSWVLERPGIHPWAKANNINGVDEGSCRTITKPITDVQKRWLTKIVEVTRGFDNVIYQVSNESFDCKGWLDDSWELSVLDFVRALHPSAVIGTNSNRDTIESAADYVESHASFAQTLRNGKPIMVNEYGDSLTPEEVRDEMRKGVLLGSSFHYWRGGHDEAAFSATLAYLRAIRSEINSRN